MTNRMVALDIDDLDDFLEAADMVGGALALSNAGSLIIYGFDGKPADIVAKMNAPGSGCPVYLDDIGETDVIGFAP